MTHANVLWNVAAPLVGAGCLIEAACRRAEHAVAVDSPRDEVGIFVDAVLAIIEPVGSYFIGGRCCRTSW